jgi:2-isopropylmalate synthase
MTAKRQRQPKEGPSFMTPTKPSTKAPSKKAHAKESQVRIFDTTLRDGEQSPGASMTLDEKLKVAALLEEMGVDIIEAGFPIASVGDFEATYEVSKLVKNSVVCALARAAMGDIDRAAEALKPAARGRIHTFIGTSPLHRQFQLQLSAEEVHERVVSSVTRARKYTDDVEWSAMDATRTEPDFLCRCIESAIKAGATTVNIPDTVGYGMPEEFFELISMIKRRVPNIDQAIISTHCHNDLGLAVANSLAGVRAGARQIECAVNGIGERAGNAALEEVVMALKVRSDAMPYWTGVKSEYIARVSKLVSSVTGFPIQYNKAIVGKNAFAHESGIHQDGVLKNAETYEIMRPEDVGVTHSTLVMGKHSGRHALREKLRELGYVLGENAFEDVFVRMKALADKKKHIFDEDIEALVENEITGASDRIKLVSLTVIAGSIGPQSATLTLDIDGRHATVQATGNGPVDATFNAIKALVPHEAKLLLYQVHAVTEGTDAQAEVSVRLEENGKTTTARGADPDTLVASARAYLSALNRLMVKRERTAPEALAAGR